MTRTKNAAIAVAALILGLFLAGLWQLFQLRFESGDIYPVYSSYRADPKGTKALFEGLSRLPGQTVERHHRSLSAVTGDSGATVLFLGVPLYTNLYRPWLQHVPDWERLAAQGARVVVGFYSALADGDKGKASEPGDAPKAGAKKGDQAEKAERRAPHERWKFQAGTLEDLGVSILDDTALLKTNPLSVSIKWPEQTIFAQTPGEWETVYQLRNDPVIMQQNYGKGSIVLLSSCYLLSNEAIRDDRSSEFLLWLTGDRRRILFDEAHLGVAAQEGVATLARRYHLLPVLFVFVVLGALYVWRHALALAPPYDEETALAADAGLIAARDSAATLAQLLRRSVPPARLLETAFQEWSKHEQPDKRWPGLTAKASALLGATRAEKPEEIIALYQRLRNLVEEYKNGRIKPH